MIDFKSQLNWARNEVEKLPKYLSKDEELEEDAKELMDSSINIPGNVALKAYDALITSKDIDTYNTLTAARMFLGRLMKGLPLTPIEDKDEEWEEFGSKTEAGNMVYRSVRYSDLYKYASPAGDLYLDKNRFIFYNIEMDHPAYCDLVEVIAEEGFAINLPYLPSEKKIIIFYDEDEFGTDHVIAVTHYLVEGKLNPKPISRFFKETVADECDYGLGDKKYVEIDKEKFKALKIRIEKNTKAAQKESEKADKLIKDAADAFVEAFKEEQNNETEVNE